MIILNIILYVLYKMPLYAQVNKLVKRVYHQKDGKYYYMNKTDKTLINVNRTISSNNLQSAKVHYAKSSSSSSSRLCKGVKVHEGRNNRCVVPCKTTYNRNSTTYRCASPSKRQRVTSKNTKTLTWHSDVPAPKVVKQVVEMVSKGKTYKDIKDTLGKKHINKSVFTTEDSVNVPSPTIVKQVKKMVAEGNTYQEIQERLSEGVRKAYINKSVFNTVIPSPEVVNQVKQMVAQGDTFEDIQEKLSKEGVRKTQAANVIAFAFRKSHCSRRPHSKWNTVLNKCECNKSFDYNEHTRQCECIGKDGKDGVIINNKCVQEKQGFFSRMLGYIKE
jgi:uncharacterized protein YerC